MNTGSLKKLSAFLIAGCLFSAFYAVSPVYGVSRIKDIADFEGVRDNQLVGYGLVVGLNGTGDNIKSVDFTKESLISMLDQIALTPAADKLKPKT